MDLVVADIIELMEEIAPANLAEDWDNSGLQIGRRTQPVHSIMVALDPLPVVIDEACQKQVDLLITHHPLFFKPLKTIDWETPIGWMVQQASINQLSIFAAHTNLDSVMGGLNDLLLELIGASGQAAMIPVSRSSHTEPIDESSRIEGLGRYGVLSTAKTLRELAGTMKAKLKTGYLRMTGDPLLGVEKIAVCTGSGSGLIPLFLKSDAQVYISGDFRYHDARDIEMNGKALIDIGHFESEHIMVSALTEKLEKSIAAKGYHVRIETCSTEKNPFVTIDNEVID